MELYLNELLYLEELLKEKANESYLLKDGMYQLWDVILTRTRDDIKKEEEEFRKTGELEIFMKNFKKGYFETFKKPYIR